uniref:RING-type domain-containing protein n=1 Tax=Rhizophagus irregularis (strain DAOM 181602 / DAOM 197198 / MUCL 43194) TaxID=747089 RepID=U9T3A3_RHIID
MASRKTIYPHEMLIAVIARRINEMTKCDHILRKSLEDATVRDMEVPELGPCSVCNNEILMLPIKAFTVLSCGHVYHRLFIEKKLLHTSTGVCPFPDCRQNVEKIDDDSPEVANRRDSQSSTSSVVGRMEKQLQINTSEVIPEEEEPDQEMDVDEETTKPNASSKKRANLIRELSSDTTRLSEIKEKRGLHREALQEVERDRTLFKNIQC